MKDPHLRSVAVTAETVGRKGMGCESELRLAKERLESALSAEAGQLQRSIHGIVDVLVAEPAPSPSPLPAISETSPMSRIQAILVRNQQRLQGCLVLKAQVRNRLDALANARSSNMDDLRKQLEGMRTLFPEGSAGEAR